MDNDTFDLLKSNIAKHKFWNNKHQNLTLVSRDSMHLDESEKPLTSSDNDLIEATWGLGGCAYLPYQEQDWHPRQPALRSSTDLSRRTQCMVNSFC